ncbi:MAG: hydroxymethylglutaryl-CoA reductase (NADPH) [Methanomassiliicoccus sp.]|nr:hydroxymethylglutaryl-CoA reductase (NADPH) [Methanomassiliicoccus sp.]
MTGEGLKNRGKTRADVDERRRAVEVSTGATLANIGSLSFDPMAAAKNIENMIGTVQVPVGFVGPLIINGQHAAGEFLVPLATTEGALLASVNRGCSVISASGGATSIVVKDAMTRAPVFRVRDARHAVEVGKWTEENFDRLKAAAEATTSHGRLLSAQPFAVGRSFYLRLSYSTGDAMGMNMATIASEAVSRLLEKETGAVLISVSGNLCVDKKPAAVNAILGRGKIVLADVTIPRKVLEEKMHATPEAVAETCFRKCSIGSSLAVSLGSNAHAANMLAALYIATGQDPAQVVEGSMTTTTCEVVDGDLYASVRLPCVEVGTVGGGTRLPCQSEALNMIGCLGEGKAERLAEIVGAVVLAGELSTLSAQAAGHLGQAHSKLGR